MANTLQTRIALKYDLYENWKNSELALHPGEIGVCEISSKGELGNDPIADVIEVPTTLFKVGGEKYEDGSLKKFKDLPWASAKAADIHSWAKASEVKFEGNKLIFVGGNADGTNLEVEFDFVTSSEVQDLKTSVSSLQQLTSGYTGEGAIKAAVDSTKDAITTLQSIVNGDNSNSKLRADITSLQALTGDSSKGNEKLRSDLDTLISTINNETDGLGAIRSAVGKNTAKIAEIASNYLKETDEYIFNCSSAKS